MLTGLCHWHGKTQETLLLVVGELHSLEQVASDQHIGTLAENLLEAMMENKSCKEAVSGRPHVHLKRVLYLSLP
jgi:E3 ubiquitin-protein ligase UBR4